MTGKVAIVVGGAGGIGHAQALGLAEAGADGESAKATTNNYGNFEFDGLNAGKYRLKLECAGYAAKTINVDLKTDSYLGDIFLARANS